MRGTRTHTKAQESAGARVPRLDTNGRPTARQVGVRPEELSPSEHVMLALPIPQDSDSASAGSGTQDAERQILTPHRNWMILHDRSRTYRLWPMALGEQEVVPSAVPGILQSRSAAEHPDFPRLELDLEELRSEARKQELDAQNAAMFGSSLNAKGQMVENEETFDGKERVALTSDSDAVYAPYNAAKYHTKEPKRVVKGPGYQEKQEALSWAEAAAANALNRKSRRARDAIEEVKKGLDAPGLADSPEVFEATIARRVEPGHEQSSPNTGAKKRGRPRTRKDASPPQVATGSSEMVDPVMATEATRPRRRAVATEGARSSRHAKASQTAVPADPLDIGDAEGLQPSTPADKSRRSSPHAESPEGLKSSTTAAADTPEPANASVKTIIARLNGLDHSGRKLKSPASAEAATSPTQTPAPASPPSKLSRKSPTPDSEQDLAPTGSSKNRSRTTSVSIAEEETTEAQASIEPPKKKRGRPPKTAQEPKSKPDPIKQGKKRSHRSPEAAIKLKDKRETASAADTSSPKQSRKRKRKQSVSENEAEAQSTGGDDTSGSSSRGGSPQSVTTLEDEFKIAAQAAAQDPDGVRSKGLRRAKKLD